MLQMPPHPRLKVNAPGRSQLYLPIKIEPYFCLNRMHAPPTYTHHRWPTWALLSQFGVTELYAYKISMRHLLCIVWLVLVFATDISILNVAQSKQIRVWRTFKLVDRSQLVVVATNRQEYMSAVLMSNYTRETVKSWANQDSSTSPVNYVLIARFLLSDCFTDENDRDGKSNFSWRRVWLHAYGTRVKVFKNTSPVLSLTCRNTHLHAYEHVIVLGGMWMWFFEHLSEPHNWTPPSLTCKLLSSFKTRDEQLKTLLQLYGDLPSGVESS